MATITYQTDEWGGIKGCVHLELNMNGKTVMINIKNNLIHIIADSISYINKAALNAVDVFIEPKITHEVRASAKCVNTHDELVEALERLLRVASVELSGKRDDVLERAREVLRKTGI